MVDALGGQHLDLPIERQMPGVFGDQHRGDHRLGGQAALDQPFGRRRLHHGLLASPAGIFGPVCHDYSELCRNDIEPLGRVLTDDMHGCPTAWAIDVVGRNRHMNARQMMGKRAAIAAALVGALARGHVGSFLSSSASPPAIACSVSSNASCS